MPFDKYSVVNQHVVECSELCSRACNCASINHDVCHPDIEFRCIEGFSLKQVVVLRYVARNAGIILSYEGIARALAGSYGGPSGAFCKGFHGKE